MTAATSLLMAEEFRRAWRARVDRAFRVACHAAPKGERAFGVAFAAALYAEADAALAVHAPTIADAAP